MNEAIPLSAYRPIEEDAESESGLVLGWSPREERRPGEITGWRTVAQAHLATDEAQLAYEKQLAEIGSAMRARITHWAPLPEIK